MFKQHILNAKISRFKILLPLCYGQIQSNKKEKQASIATENHQYFYKGISIFFVGFGNLGYSLPVH